jgi:hypothetical protein
MDCPGRHAVFASYANSNSAAGGCVNTRHAKFAQDLEFARFIALIRGHFLTGDELVSQRERDLANRHFSYPREEIYGIIRDELRDY